MPSYYKDHCTDNGVNVEHKAESPGERVEGGLQRASIHE